MVGRPSYLPGSAICAPSDLIRSAIAHARPTNAFDWFHGMHSVLFVCLLLQSAPLYRQLERQPVKQTMKLMYKSGS